MIKHPHSSDTLFILRLVFAFYESVIKIGLKNNNTVQMK